MARFPVAFSQSRIRASVHNFFVYLADAERWDMRRMIRKSVIFLGVGIVTLLLSMGWGFEASKGKP